MKNIVLAYVISVLAAAATSQPQPQAQQQPAGEWAGKRIVLLRGLGEFHPGDGSPERDAVGVNLVTVALRIEGDRVWINSTGGDQNGWVEKKNAMLLEDAPPYFEALVRDDPMNWDAWLRRAEVEHALNQREASLADYAKAISLHPGEAFLFLRRGRHLWTMHDCRRALADYQQALDLSSGSAVRGYDLGAEVLSLEAGVYDGCPDTGFRDSVKAIAAAQDAVRRAPERPTLLSILAAAYASASNFEKAVETQRRALASPQFPPGYREQGTAQLQSYEKSLAEQRKVK